MARRRDEDDIADEPHWRAESASQRPAGNPRTDRPAARAFTDAELAAGHSVFDEPGIRGDPAAAIERDWSCSRCGYNLRGLRVGQPCPECAHVELYVPAPRGAAHYGDWLARKMAATRGLHVALAVTAATLVGALISAPATIFTEVAGFGPMPLGPAIIQSVLIAPPVEEVMKLLAALVLVERLPYLMRAPWHLKLVAFGGAAGFAIVENLLYLTVYFPGPPDWMIAYRWLACTALHLACTMFAAGGLVRVWKRTVTDGRPPRLSLAMPRIFAAIALHAAYNFCVTMVAGYWTF